VRARGFILAVCLAAGVVLGALPVAASAEGCPNVAFRTGPSAALPDCRAYELVTPVAKNGGYVEVDNQTGANRVLANGLGGGLSADGESVVLASQEGFGETESVPGAFPFSLYRAVRTDSGWVTTSLDPSAAQFEIEGGKLGDLNAGYPGGVVWLMRSASQPDNAVGVYRVGYGEAPVEAGPFVPPSSPAGSVNNLVALSSLVGVSADGSHVLFALNSSPLWPGEVFGTGSGSTRPLLEYVGAGNHEPLLVGVGNEGQLIDGCPYQRLGAGEHNQFGLGEGYEQFSEWTQNAISTNGETVFFTVVCNAQVYARIGNGTPGAHTVAISEPTVADCAGCAAEDLTGIAEFDGASEDGSRVFFSRSSDTGLNLYEYDFDAAEGQRVIRVTAGDGTVPVTAPELQGMVQVSPDGSHVYFVAHGVLTSTANYAGLSAQPGGDNLYLYERDAQYPDGHTVFIATLSPRDEELWRVDEGSNVTPDGRFLALVSRARLTADDSSSAGQLFEYDAQANTMTRISIGEGGYNDDGNIHQAKEQPRIVSPVYRPEPYLAMAYSDSLTMSGDGSYVFFESPDALVPGALDVVPETGYTSEEMAENVYEYHDGNVYLISDGQYTGPVSLNGTDLSGRDVLISTGDPLVAQAQGSTNVDVYDARVDGGFPAPAPPEECEGDACQGSLGAAPVLLSPGSEFQQGGENVTSPPVTPVVSAKAKKKPKKPKHKAKAKPKDRGKSGRRGKSARRTAKRAGRGVGGRS
jgi:hypothetical protein